MARYAMLVKIYGPSPEGERRDSPAERIRRKRPVLGGRPDPEHTSTSHSERQNPTMRMSMRSLCRLTNAFSKKIENHARTVDLYFLHDNFVRIHKTPRGTRTAQTGIADHGWTYEEVARLLERSAQ